MFEENLFDDSQEVEYQHMLDSIDRHTLREDAYIEKIKALTKTDALSQLVKHLISKHGIRVKPKPYREFVSESGYKLLITINGIPFKTTKDAAKHFDISVTTVITRCKSKDAKYAAWTYSVQTK